MDHVLTDLMSEYFLVKDKNRAEEMRKDQGGWA